MAGSNRPVVPVTDGLAACDGAGSCSCRAPWPPWGTAGNARVWRALSFVVVSCGFSAFRTGGIVRMSTLEMVTTSVRRAIENFNTSESQKVPLAGSTVLLGAGGAVDSLGLVRLVLTVERQIRDDFGVGISLTDEKAMSQRNSPFRSIDSLVS